MNLNIRITNHIKGEQEILEQFLYYAVFVRPNTPKPPHSIVHEPELQPYIAGWGKPDDHAVFACLDENVVGVCWTRCFAKDQHGYGTIAPEIPELSIAVLPEHRSKGIGSKMLSTLIQNIKNDYPAVSLSVSTSNPAKALHERFGFRTVRKTSETVIMIKDFYASCKHTENRCIEN